MLKAPAAQQTEEVVAPVAEGPKKEPEFGSVEWIHTCEEEGLLPSPINVSITGSTRYFCPELKWYNFDVYPHKIKMTNTGYTVSRPPTINTHSLALPTSKDTKPDALINTSVAILSDILGNREETLFNIDKVVIGAKWRAERPYLEGGPFLEKHVLSQIHFHWGADITEGSEHTVDKRRYPGEMQVTFFRAEYMTQDEAFKHPDGVVMICYIIKYGVNEDVRLSRILEGFPRIKEAHTSTRIGPYPMSQLLPMFFEDYFLYWGRLDTSKGEQMVLRWLIPRITLFASFDQMKEFRKLWNPWDEPLERNYRPLQPRGDRHVFFINPHWNQYNSLLPIPRIPEKSISILSPTYQNNLWLLPPQNAYMLPQPEESEEEHD